MQKFQFKMFMGFMIIVVTFIAYGGVIFSLLGEVEESGNWVVHTQEVIGDAHQLTKQLVDMETGQRGFLIVGNEGYLEPYNTGLKAFHRQLTLLKKRVSDNPQQVARLLEIEAQVNRWQQKAAIPEITTRRTMSSDDLTLINVQDLLAKGVGKKILDTLRGAFNELRTLIKAPSSPLSTVEKLKAERDIYALAKAMVDQETGQRGFLITGKTEFLEPYISGQQEFSIKLTDLLSRLSSYAKARRKLVRIQILAAQWQRDAAQPEISARRRVNQAGTSFRDIQTMLKAETGKNIMDNLRQQIGEFIAVEKILISERLAEAERFTDNAFTYTLWGLLVAIMVAAAAILWISRSITNPLNALTQAMENASERSDFSARVPERVGTLETNQLGAIFNQIAANAEDQVWLKMQTVTLSKAVSSAKDSMDLCVQLIATLGDVFGCAYASIFLLDEPGKIYEMVATYRLKLPKDFPRSFEPGEGLIGQCGKENKIKWLDAGNGEFIKAHCGIVDVPPASLVAFPLAYGEQVLAVVELACFANLTPIQFNLLEEQIQVLGLALENQLKATRAERQLTEMNQQQKWELDEQRTTLTNITDEIRDKAKALEVSEVQLTLANEELMRAAEHKSEFISNMSHEIRTPMSTIIGTCYLIAQTNLSEKQQNYLKKIDLSAQSLLRIINDILDFSKIEAGKLDFEEAPFDLNELISKLEITKLGHAQEKGVEIIYDIGADVPYLLVGDSIRLGQVLNNLCDNAAKFTNQGEIVIGIKLLGRSNQDCELQFSVKDTGIGMSPEQCKKIFGAFEQADTSTTREYGGTGLGLAICSKLVDLMKGKIDVESEVGRGSTFTFTVMLGCADADGRFDDLVKRATGKHRVLVVDDNASARQIIHQTLLSFSIYSEAAHSGAAALVELERAVCDGERPYDLVLMDWNMPEMNGIEAIQKIHESEVLSSPPVVIMVSAYDEPEVVDAAQKVGVAGFLKKPISPSDLYNAMTEIFGGQIIETLKPENQDQLDEAVKRSLNGLKVLLAEDYKMNQEMVTEVLEMFGVEVTVANNGREACDILRVAKRPFDLVLMDVQMPLLDGHDATRFIRQWEGFEDLPIIALTASAMVDDVKECLEAGMTTHVAKPIDFVHLLHLMAELVGGPVNQTSDRALPAADMDVPHEDEDPWFPETLEGFDVAAGLQRVLGQKSLYLSMLARFSEGNKDLVKRLKNAIKKDDQEGARNLVHGLMGVAGNLDATALYRATQAFEKCLIDDNQGQQKKLLKALEAALKTALQSIAAIQLKLLGQTRQKPDRDQGTNEAAVSDLRKLLMLLRKSDFTAEQAFENLRPVLPELMVKANLRKLEKAISELNTQEAAIIVEDSLKALEEAQRGG